MINTVTKEEATKKILTLISEKEKELINVVKQVNQQKLVHYLLFKYQNAGVGSAGLLNPWERIAYEDLRQSLYCPLAYALRYGTHSNKKFDRRTAEDIVSKGFDLAYCKAIKMVVFIANLIYEDKNGMWKIVYNQDFLSPEKKALAIHLGRCFWHKQMANPNVSAEEILYDYKKEFSRYTNVVTRFFDLEFYDLCKLLDAIFYLSRCKSFEIFSRICKSLGYYQHPTVSTESFNISFGEYFFKEKDLITELHKQTNINTTKIQKFIKKLILHPEEINVDLRKGYTILWTKPIPMLKNGELIICPGIFAEAMYEYTHFSIMNSNLKEGYKKRHSDNFVSDTITIFKKYGFNVPTEYIGYEIKHNKKTLGEIDLIAKNDKIAFVVECKAHLTPEQARMVTSPEYLLETRLPYLKEIWIKQVKRVEEYVKSNLELFDLDGLRTYFIIISYTPEIISYFADLPVLTLHELDYWLEKYEKEGKLPGIEEFLRYISKGSIDPFSLKYSKYLRIQTHEIPEEVKKIIEGS